MEPEELDTASFTCGGCGMAEDGLFPRIGDDPGDSELEEPLSATVRSTSTSWLENSVAEVSFLDRSPAITPSTITGFGP
jgi:hypothetical protein